MKVVDLTKTTKEDAGVMAFGFFDSIHVGHRKVICDAVRLAKQNGVSSSVFLFRNNIFPLFGVEKYPIFTFEERLALIEALGVDVVYFVDADKDFLSMSPDGFLDVLKSKLVLKGFTCGKDFTFGAEGKGGVEDLKRAIGGAYEISDLLTVEGEKISSERVKIALSEGNLALVETLLDRPFCVKRKVISGRNDGAKIGFPTINTELLTAPLKPGVYFTEITAGGKRYMAVTHVGTHPTFDDLKINIESHLLDYSGNLYENEVEITFLKYHRGIVKFSKITELTAQIAADVSARREYDQIRTVRHG